MTVAREQLIDINATPYYHVINRCVRRAFLCGNDHYSGKSYEHRRQWIVDKIKELSGVFAIDICAYAIMSNHYHLVLHVNSDKAKEWNSRAVIERWYTLFKGNLLVDKYLNRDALSQAELNAINDCVEQWRKRLMNVSWYMRCLNEAIARQANKEDKCRGRFWEGRFKSQALFGETALLTCMMYVDLNPIRAGMTQALDTSDFTSIQERIFAIGRNLRQAQQRLVKSKSNSTPQVTARQKETDNGPKAPETNLYPFLGAERRGNNVGIAYSLVDYLGLIDWTGRAIRDDKKGAIPAHIQPLLDKLNINEDEWLHGVSDFGQCFGCAMGPQHSLKRFSTRLNKSWLQGIKASQRFYRVVSNTKSSHIFE